MSNILIVHGPNLNLLGDREPAIYGKDTLADINLRLTQLAADLQHDITIVQHNAEGEMVNTLQQMKHHNINFLIINPAAYTHTSIAIRDTLLALDIPFIEIHLSNLHQRESFRQQSFLADLAIGVIQGFGGFGYELALQAAHHYLNH